MTKPSARAAPLAKATKERGRLAAAQANLAEITRLRSELVEAAAVEAEWGGMLRTVRTGILAVPSRVAARLSASSVSLPICRLRSRCSRTLPRETYKPRTAPAGGRWHSREVRSFGTPGLPDRRRAPRNTAIRHHRSI